MWEQNEGRVNQCVKFLTRAIDKNSLETESDKFKNDFKSFSTVLGQLTMYLHEFNFYPSQFKGNCCEVAFFTSLIGNRWNINQDDKITFEKMYHFLINHCQGTCSTKTQYAVIVTDNWDDDIANFWQPNIELIKSKGVIVEVYLVIGSNTVTYQL